MLMTLPVFNCVAGLIPAPLNRLEEDDCPMEVTSGSLPREPVLPRKSMTLPDLSFDEVGMACSVELLLGIFITGMVEEEVLVEEGPEETIRSGRTPPPLRRGEADDDEDFTFSGRLNTNFCWLVADAATFPELTFSGGLKINCLLLDVENVDDKLIFPAIRAGELDCDPRPKLKVGMVETLGGVNPAPAGESGVGCAASGLGAEALRLDLDKALFILPPPPPNPEEPDISRVVVCGGASCWKRLPPKVTALFMDCSLFDTLAGDDLC